MHAHRQSQFAASNTNTRTPRCVKTNTEYLPQFGLFFAQQRQAGHDIIVGRHSEFLHADFHGVVCAEKFKTKFFAGAIFDAITRQRTQPPSHGPRVPSTRSVARMVPPLKRKESVKRQSFMVKRKSLKIEDPEHFTISQLKQTLRAASVSEHDIAMCIERSQLNTLYKERLDVEFKACVAVQRHWRMVLEWRQVGKMHTHSHTHTHARTHNTHTHTLPDHKHPT